MKKSCLKSGQPTPAASPGPEARTNTGICKHKCVAFCPNTQQVWEADDWDRTPYEPVRNLSYQDLLELKEIQKSLPRAVQPFDACAARPYANQYLSKVPVGLLPLLQSDEPPKCSPVDPPEINYSSRSKGEYHEEDATKSPPVTYSAPSALFPRGFAMKQERSSSPPKAPPTYYRPPNCPQPQHNIVPAHLAHLAPPPAAPQPRKATFTFLPLLDTHQTSPKQEEDPPTPSLTNASLDSSPNPSPRSQASDLPDTPLSDQHTSSYFPAIQDPHQDKILPPVVAFKRSMNLHTLPPPPTTLLPPSPPSSQANSPPQQHVPVEVKRRKKQVIFINDMEVELDEDEPESAPCSPSTSSSSPCSLASFSPIPPSPSTPPRLIRGFQFLPVNGCAGSPPTPVASPLSRMGCAPLSMHGSPPPTGNVGFVKSS